MSIRFRRRQAIILSIAISLPLLFYYRECIFYQYYQDIGQRMGSMLSESYETIGEGTHYICIYKEKTGSFPSEMNGRTTATLVRELRTEDLSSFIIALDKDGNILDGFGNRLIYIKTNPKYNMGYFDLYSVGPNGIDEYNIPGNGDDFTNWNKETGKPYDEWGWDSYDHDKEKPESDDQQKSK